MRFPVFGGLGRLRSGGVGSCERQTGSGSDRWLQLTGKMPYDCHGSGLYFHCCCLPIRVCHPLKSKQLINTHLLPIFFPPCIPQCVRSFLVSSLLFMFSHLEFIVVAPVSLCFNFDPRWISCWSLTCLDYTDWTVRLISFCSVSSSYSSRPHHLLFEFIHISPVACCTKLVSVTSQVSSRLA